MSYIQTVMRTHLPREPDELHSWDDIHLIDDDTHKRYANTVAFAERITAHCVHIPDNDADTALQHLSKRNQSLVMLTEMQVYQKPTPVVREYDVISAFYLPSNLHWFQLWIGGVVAGKWVIHSPPALSDILKEARTVPAANPHHLEDLLALARCGGNVGYIHLPHSQITLDGVEYTRLEAMQPFLPFSRLANTSVTINTSEPCTVYIEQFHVGHPERGLLCANNVNDVYYIEGQWLGVATINNGYCDIFSEHCKLFIHNTDHQPSLPPGPYIPGPYIPGPYIPAPSRASRVTSFQEPQHMKHTRFTRAW